MNKNLVSKFFGAYIGSRIILDQSRFIEEEDDRLFTLSGVSKTGFILDELQKIKYRFEVAYNNKYIDKLLLKSPLSITDEHALELAEILGIRLTNKASIEMVQSWLSDDRYFFSGYFMGRTNKERDGICVIEAIDYLREKGYATRWGKYSIKELEELNLIEIEK